jgi:hypothetical protein
MTTPIAFALKNYYTWGFLEVPTVFLPLLDLGGRFTSETAAQRFQN